MTTQRVHLLALNALGRIARTPKGHVRAARTGLAMAFRFPKTDTSVIFRRGKKGVGLEIWQGGGNSNLRVERYPLPADLERAAGVVLDAL